MFEAALAGEISYGQNMSVPRVHFNRLANVRMSPSVAEESTC